MHTLFHSRGRAWTAAAVAAALTLIAGASAGVNTPHSGWYSGNPTLGPNNLTDLVCGGSTCYAAGAFGTLLKSTNAGSSWSGVVTGLTLDLRRVRTAGSPDRIVGGGGCSLRRSDDGGATFQRLPFSASDLSCPAAVGAFSFPSSAVGYIVLANNAVLSTADGGQTFTRRTAVPVGPPATDLLCTSDTTCFTTSGGTVHRTTDGAVTWTQVAGFSLPLFRPRAGGRYDALRGRSVAPAAQEHRRRCDVGAEDGGRCPQRGLRLDPLLRCRQLSAGDAAGKPDREDDGRW